jgi:hypothetical protein
MKVDGEPRSIYRSQLPPVGLRHFEEMVGMPAWQEADDRCG